MGVYAITGSGSGIGAATRARLERRAHTVIGVDLAGAEVTADLGSAEGREAAITEVRRRCDGRLSGLVTAAGIGPPADPVATVSVNHFGTEAVLDGLRACLEASGSARCVALSSNSTTITPNVPPALVEACCASDEPEARRLAADQPSAMAYAASKIAISRYVRRRAPSEEWAGAGIRLNAIAPGATMTPLAQAGLDSDEVGEAMRTLPIPTGGFGRPDEIAAWIEQMLVGDGAGFMCGSIVFVDGGTDALIRPDAFPAPFEL